MLSRQKPIIALSCFLLLSLQLVFQVHCVEEEAPPPKTATTPPKEAGAGTSGSGGSRGTLGDGYVPYAAFSTFGKPIGPGMCNLTPLVVDTGKFDKLCGPNSNPNWPCFTHEDNSEDDLTMVNVEPWLKPLNMTEAIIARDSKSFTLKDPSNAFIITYQRPGGVSLIYYDYDPKTGCFNVHLNGRLNQRIHISTTNHDYRDLDTMNYLMTGKRICSKWVNIATRKRDDFNDFIKGNDGKNI